MEILANIGLIALGAVIGAVIMACISAGSYVDVLQDAYDKGREDGQKSMRGEEDAQKR